MLKPPNHISKKNYEAVSLHTTSWLDFLRKRKLTKLDLHECVV